MTRWMPASTLGRCPTCGAAPARLVHIQEPLLRGAGYGAAARIVVDVCGRCWTTRLVAVESVAPARDTRPEAETVPAWAP